MKVTLEIDGFAEDLGIESHIKKIMFDALSKEIRSAVNSHIRGRSAELNSVVKRFTDDSVKEMAKVFAKRYTAALKTINEEKEEVR